MLRFRQSKTGAQLEIRITPEIDECLRWAAGDGKKVHRHDTDPHRPRPALRGEINLRHVGHLSSRLRRHQGLRDLRFEGERGDRHVARRRAAGADPGAMRP